MFKDLYSAIDLDARADTFLGLGKGGMERMIAYPALLWAVGFGGYLIGYSGDTSTAKES